MLTTTIAILASLQGTLTAAQMAAPVLQVHPTETATVQGYTPHRVYEAKQQRLGDVEAMAAAAARADIVFFGEQHDDGGTHRMELALLEAVSRRRTDVVVSLEMFERDTQGILDQYLAGTISEATFLAAARPWPNYAADYRPLVEFAKAHGWKVIAANVPRPIASAVSSKGLVAVTDLTDSTRRWAAEEFQCPKGRYFDNFVIAMSGHGAAGADADARNMRFYQAQCVKDETMAESIVRAHAGSASPPLVIHYNGAFHSDFGDGTAERVQRRLRGAEVMLISSVPVSNLDAKLNGDDRKKADWIVYTLMPTKKE